VSKGQTIARLEALLSRVRTRAVEPRRVAVQAAVPEANAAPEVAAAPPPPPVFELDEPVEDLESTQQRAVPSRPGPMRTEADIVVEVEVQATTQETVVAVPVEEVAAPAALESRERLVVAEPVAPAASEPLSAPDPQPEPSPVVAVEVEVVEEVLPEVEEVEAVEEAPVSSRRPVAPPPEERLDEMAFGAVEPQPPRHTPPPESGRLPAVPEVEFEGDITGVRDAARSAHPAAAAPAAAIVPEATIADLSPSGDVADVIEPARTPAPATFVGVLDQSIAL
jgi:hypothetical protein